jgi:predicted transcriptional regulator
MFKDGLAQAFATRPRRGQIEILVRILTSASLSSAPKGVTKTHLAHASGLNFRRFEKYLDLLEQKRLVKHVEDEQETGSEIYGTTPTGERTRLLLLEAENLIFGDSSDQCRMPALLPPEDRW